MVGILKEIRACKFNKRTPQNRYCGARKHAADSLKTISLKNMWKLISLSIASVAGWNDCSIWFNHRLKVGWWEHRGMQAEDTKWDLSLCPHTSAEKWTIYLYALQVAVLTFQLFQFGSQAHSHWPITRAKGLCPQAVMVYLCTMGAATVSGQKLSNGQEPRHACAFRCRENDYYILLLNVLRGEE